MQMLAQLRSLGDDLAVIQSRGNSKPQKKTLDAEKVKSVNRTKRAKGTVPDSSPGHPYMGADKSVASNNTPLLINVG